MKKIITFREGAPGVGDMYGFPEQSKMFVPNWYKKIPAYRKIEERKLRLGRQASTIKQCMPFLDAFTSGYMITVPHDIGIDVLYGEVTPYWQADRSNLASVFQKEYSFRSDGLPTPDGYLDDIWRVDVEFFVSLPKGYSLLCTHPFNRYDLPFLVLTGIIDADKATGTFSATIYLKKDFVGVIEKGTPLMQILPFKREDWTRKNLPWNEEFYRKAKFDLFSKIERSYQNKFWSKKIYD